MGALFTIALVLSSTTIVVFFTDGSPSSTAGLSTGANKVIKKNASIILETVSTSYDVGMMVHTTGTLTGAINGYSYPIKWASVHLSIILPDGSVAYPIQGTSTLTNKTGSFGFDYSVELEGTYLFKAILAESQYCYGTNATITIDVTAQDVDEPEAPMMEPDPTAISLDAQDSVQTGNAMLLSGILTTTEGVAISGADVFLQITFPNGSTSTSVAVTTNADGGFSYTVVPTAVGSYVLLACFAGDAENNASSTTKNFIAYVPEEPVLPAEPAETSMSLLGPSNVQTGYTGIITGILTTTAGVELSGASVQVLVTYPNGSTSSSVTITTDVDGAFSYTVIPSIEGTFTVNSSFSGDSDNEGCFANISFTAHASEEPVTPTTYDYIISGTVVKSSTGKTMYTGSTFTVALNWAMDQANKVVYVPAGTYTVTSSVTPVSGTTLFGDGSGTDGTILYFSGTTFQTARIWINEVNDVTLSDLRISRGHVQIQASSTVCSDFLLQNIIFYQTDKIMPASFLTYTANKGEIHNVRVYRCQAIETGCMGFLLSGDIGGSDTTARTNGGWTKNVRFEECSAIWCGKNGQHNAWVCGFDLNEGANADGVYLVRCVANYNYMDGFHMEMWPYSLNVTYEDCSASGNGQKGSGYGFIYRTETGVHETALIGCTGMNNKNGDSICVTTHVVSDLPNP